MIKSSLRSVGMTECLINFKYMVFGQPNQMDGKYCLSWQAGWSINFVLFVLVVASTGRLTPIITPPAWHKLFISSRDCRQRPPLLSTGGKHKDKCFLLGAPLRSTWGFHKSSTCPFPGTTKHLSIPAPLAPPARHSCWPVFEAAAGAPPLGSPLRKAPRRVDETRPQPAPNSHCEVHKRFPFSPDIHKKDSLTLLLRQPSTKIQSSHLFSLSQSLFVPSTFSAYTFIPLHGLTLWR